MQADTAPAKRRTAPKEIRRLQLIMAAIDSISKRGFAATTLRHVTEQAKLSHGVVNYHFQSKEAFQLITSAPAPLANCHLLVRKHLPDAITGKSLAYCAAVS